MKPMLPLALTFALALTLSAAGPAAAAAPKTTVSIEGDKFFINGKPTYEGRTWKGKKIEGLMMNSRMVQGIFDDFNPETRPRWARAWRKTSPWRKVWVI